MERVIKILLLDSANEFIRRLPDKARNKVLYNMSRVAKGERDVELFKKLENSSIWEFRTLHNKIAYRLFAFWDHEIEAFVVVTHGIVKKTQKTPSKEIVRATAIMRRYFEEKHKKQ